MEKSNTEVYLRRLLVRCEERGRNFANDPGDWRLPKFIEAANEMLASLAKCDPKPPEDDFNEYKRRIDFLKKLVESRKDAPIERVVAAQMLPKSVSSDSENIIKEIQQTTTSKYVNDVRQELFGGDELRRRNEKSTGEDFDAILKHHMARQEVISEDMLNLTRNLKEQSKIAQIIIQKDIETMNKSDNQTNQNNQRLSEAATILAEYNRRAWKCWMWALLVLVMAVFIVMVMLLKVM